MRRLLSILALVLVATLTACGGGSGGGGGPVSGPGPGSGTLNAQFTPDQPNPGADTLSLDEGSTAAELVTLEVQITETDGVYGAAFDLTYNAGVATFVNWAPGSVLEQGGQGPAYQVSATNPGRLVVGASRQGDVSGVDVNGTVTLIHLVFRMNQAGSSTAQLENASLLDDSLPPQAVPGLSIFGGTMTAN